MNKHIYNNLYKGRIRTNSILLYVLNFLTFGCLTSIFLYGTYSIFNPDLAYLFGIIVLVLISIFNNSFFQKPYWVLRPKINQSLFSNFFNITSLIFAVIYSTLIIFNYQNGLVDVEFGTTGSLIFAAGLPFSYYIWMIFTQTNEEAIAEIIENTSLKSYKKYEIYFLLIFITIFGLIYDYLPQSVDVLLLVPTGLLFIFSLLNAVLNRKIHSDILLYFNAIKKSQKVEIEKDSIIGIYEKLPYQLISKIELDFLGRSFSEQKYLLFTLKRISAIDALEQLETLVKNCDKKNPIFNTLVEVHDYLSNVEDKISKIENPYEFIEQSNDIILIKGVIRQQIKNEDRNLIIKLLNDNRISVKKPACIVAGYYEDINIISILIEHLEKPELTYWAQLALQKIGKKALKYIEIEFSKRNANLLFVESSFNLISKLGNEEGYNLLFKALNEPDSNVRKIAAKKIILYNLKVTEDHRKYFTKLFDDLVLTLLSNGYILQQLESKNENFKSLKNALYNENKESLYLIINIAKLYYNESAIEKIFEHYGKNSCSLHASSNILIELIVRNNISVRNKIKVLFSPNEKLLLESLQEEFPSINLKPKFKFDEDLIWLILKKEYDQINSWTRVCALNIIQYSFKDDIPFELASEFLNKNQLLKETAALNIYKNLPEFYTIFLSRLNETEAKQIDYLIRSNLDTGNQKQINADNFLLYDKINFLISTPYLNKLSISEIINAHRYFRVKVLRAGEHQLSLNEEFNLGYWLIETGKISFSKNGIDFYEYGKRDIVKVSDHESPSENVYFYLEEDTRFLIVEEIILINIIRDYDYIMQKYIDILPDKSPKKHIKELNQNAA
ncbi:hypothetical protein [uncultured Marivirga sp.]|uniref:hypothetical protein n=1 Tax=uncultured Marivirga sp. TaxID=1123707 RepID=UPI0030EB1307